MRPLSAEPWLFPWKVMRDARCVEFLEMTRELFDAIVFHDPPQLEGRAPVAGRLAFDDVIAYHREAGHRLAAPRYVFHHGFCCSTLLVRSLGPPTTVFAYREPAALTELAIVDLADRGFVRSEPGRGVLAALAALHGRVEPGTSQAPVIKACDAVNGIIEPLMEAHGEARAVLLYSDLDSFVMRCLVSNDRRTWTRGRVPAFQCWADAAVPGESQLGALSDGEAAACLWGLHMHVFAEAARRLPGRILPLDCEELLADPAGTARAVARFLGLPEDEAARQAEGARLVHAKNGIPYGAESRRADLAALRPMLREELDGARRWYEKRSAGTPLAALHLGEAGAR